MVNMTNSTGKKTSEADPERDAKRSRLRDSLLNVGKSLVKHEEVVTGDRDQRRKLILLALEDAETGHNLFTYDELAAITGLTRGAIYKIVRDGYKEAPLTEQRADAAKATKGAKG